MILFHRESVIRSGQDASVTFREQDVFGSGETVIRAWSVGDGPHQIFICNDIGAPADCWAGLMTALGDDYTLVGFHYRGTSGSSRPLHESETGIDHHVADAAAVMSHYELAAPLTIGWSTGVPIAYQLAATRPSLVSSLLAIAGLPRGGAGRLVEMLSGTFISGVAQASRLVPSSVMSVINKAPVDSATAQFMRRSGLASADVPPELLTRIVASYLEQDHRWYLKLISGAANSDLDDADPVRCPTQFLMGRSDILVPAPLALDTVRQLPQAELEIVPGTHFLPLEQPAVVAAAVRSLANEHIGND